MVSSRCGVFLLLVVVLSAAAPSAKAQLPSLINTLFVVSTSVFCTETGNPCTNVSTPVVGLTGSLICSGLTLGNGTTNSNGLITIVVSRVPQRLIGSVCSIVFPLTNNTLCPLLRGPGSISAVTNITSVVNLPLITSILNFLTRILVGVAGPLTRLPV